MANDAVGKIKTAHLAEFLGPELTVKRSGRDGAKYPLYLSTCLGPVHLNTRAAQDLALEHGEFFANAEARAAANAEPEPVPAVAPAPVPKPEPAPEKKSAPGLLEF